MRKTIIVAGTGTSHAQADLTCIRPVEDAVRLAFPEYDVCRAFTSRRILEKLRRQGMNVRSAEEAVALLDDSAVCAASTHIIPGSEYAGLVAAAGSLPVSAPLLAGEEDLLWMAELLDGIAAEEGRPLLLMGHGSGSAADEIYLRLRRKLSPGVYLACMKGRLSLESCLPHLRQKEITLMPLMLAAGEHAMRDLAGDAETSWKSILTARGFDVYVRMQGLGSFPEVQQRFVQKIRNVL